MTIDYLLPNRYYDEQVLYVPAKSRITLDVNSRIPDMEVSIFASSLIELVIERPIYFNYGDGWTGGHDTVASPSGKHRLVLRRRLYRPRFRRVDLRP